MNLNEVLHDGSFAFISNNIDNVYHYHEKLIFKKYIGSIWLVGDGEMDKFFGNFTNNVHILGFMSKIYIHLLNILYNNLVYGEVKKYARDR
jgi:hypothetical protein